MKGDHRPQILLYLLVGALLLSTALNAYFLLRLDANLADQQVQAQLQDDNPAREQPSVTLQLPAAPAPPDTVQELKPYPSH
ncbi:hypothetical protein I2I05_18705 [Hymenobacter sp. BT683]|uniref:Energy transducer TonB n=1 Tax=Hymenobacter jeongseonensis TaxID=2791027 RepID=A0ABS0IM34_9BACT|nr:hypothetical protein [Hymenobacter jeongseonensis]MBF9239430.1 hypothetical protein [Hymenobacter jeongseonensis]